MDIITYITKYSKYRVWSDDAYTEVTLLRHSSFKDSPEASKNAAIASSLKCKEIQIRNLNLKIEKEFQFKTGAFLSFSLVEIEVVGQFVG